MRKQLTVALGLAVLATPAFASKARLQALGEDSYGSFYINDNRNIWLNAAQINNHKDLVTYEFGGVAATDSADTARGEAGIYKTMGNMVYGAHFNGASNTTNGFRDAAGVDTGEAGETNNLDLFVGGDAGVKWGANFGYARTAREGSAISAESMRTRFGAIMGDLQAFATVSLGNRAKDAAGDKFDGELGYQLGATYNWQDYTLFAQYGTNSGEANNAGVKKDLSATTMTVGAGRVTRLNDKTNLFTKVQYTRASYENDRAVGQDFAAGCTTLGCEEYSASQIPATVGIETDATSWLTLRVSATHALYAMEEDKKNERSQVLTSVNAGATLKFGELSIDGVIGNSTNEAADGVRGENTASGNATLRTDVLMSRVSMTYNF